ncbi:MAG: ATP-binding protein [Boseongicola sp. SB0662_bin_57]|nr:ATP-binding protein [Boseongicola sp. SB0662_bin_57]
MTVRPTASISRIRFSGGQEFSFSPNEKVVLVGPNNSGKSRTLREISEIAEKGQRAWPLVVEQVEFEKVGSAKQLRAFLEENAEFHDGSYTFRNWRIREHLIAHWEDPYLEFDLAHGYLKNIDTKGRLAICEQQESIRPSAQKRKPQQVLYDDSALMNKVSTHFRQAFGQDIMFDYRGGSRIPIHVGEKPDASLVDRVGDRYVAAVRVNPLLDEQGDGMKSYAGTLFETLVADLDINLLDEPEAFLDPPQMRRLGQTLASEVRGQLFVATHSSDIMRGFLEGTRGDVRILRISRDGEANFVSEAAPEVVQEMWSRPELRYSNALEGVFHDETIICEDDSDCRLLNAVADHLAASDGNSWKDTAYVPAGGKHGIRKVAEVLRKVGVPVKAVFDIDFLSEEELVKSTVGAFGGKWQDFQTLWSRVDAAVRKGVKLKTCDEIKDELIELVQNSGDGGLPRGDLIEAMKQGSAWNIVKRGGKSDIPRGDAQTNFAKLSKLLEGIGIYLVHVGEVENFCGELGSHGPKLSSPVQN